MIVGLAGKTCAGKDTLVPFFVDRGFACIDADALGHRALEANREAVLARFGTVDRKALGATVFSNKQALTDLEAITHPWIGSEIRRLVAAATTPVVINAALLHKEGLFQLCDVVVWVQAPLWTRLLRARHRDRSSWWRIFSRVWSQRKLGTQVFPPNVDILKVNNRGSSLNRDIPLEARRMLEARFGRVPALPKKEDTHEKQ